MSDVIFTVSLPKSIQVPYTGRVRLYVSLDEGSKDPPAPMDATTDSWDSNQVFGVDVINWKAGEQIKISSSLFDANSEDGVKGYPLLRTDLLPRGVPLKIQAELAVYSLYEREGLPDTWLPTACVSNGGENGKYAKPAGTRYSNIASITLPSAMNDVNNVQAYSVPDILVLSEETPDFPSPGCAGLGDGVDSKYIKTLRIKSQRLSKFWKKEISLEACVLLPFGFDEHPTARYPIAISHGHYSPKFEGFSSTFPDCDVEKDGYSCINDQYAFYLYSNWTSDEPSSPFVNNRFLVATINHPVPLFDDSYAVNTATLGPYGDAINYELIPAIEDKYRGNIHMYVAHIEYI